MTALLRFTNGETYGYTDMFIAIAVIRRLNLSLGRSKQAFYFCPEGVKSTAIAIDEHVFMSVCVYVFSHIIKPYVRTSLISVLGRRVVLPLTSVLELTLTGTPPTVEYRRCNSQNS